MSDISCYITTFNCGRTLIDVPYFAVNFFNALKTNLPPDLVVLALEEIAPIGYSFLGGSFLTPYFVRLSNAVDLATGQRFEEEVEYESVVVRNVGMTALMVFAKSGIRERIKWIETAGVGVGVWEMGNKGAVAARLALDVDADDGEEMILTFVGAHLAPMEDAWEARNQDWKKIYQGLVFDKHSASRSSQLSTYSSEEEPLLDSSGGGARAAEESTLFSPTTYIFFSGDLNYRTSDTSPAPADYESWPQPVDTTSDKRHYSHLLAHDQLARERSKGKVFQHLSEAEIKFPPTYKYSEAASNRAKLASQKQETSAVEDDVWLWAKHRVPSWCDRILYLQTAPPTVHSYAALPVQPTSDHRPVVLSCSMPLKALDDAQAVEPPFQIRKDWREARAAAKRYESIVGVAAYLALTWEGEILTAGTLVGAIGGYVALRALIGA